MSVTFCISITFNAYSVSVPLEGNEIKFQFSIACVFTLFNIFMEQLNPEVTKRHNKIISEFALEVKKSGDHEQHMVA